MQMNQNTIKIFSVYKYTLLINRLSREILGHWAKQLRAN